MGDTQYSIGIMRPLLLGVLVLNLAVMSFAGFDIYNSRRQSEEQAAINTQNLSQVLEKSISGLVDKIDLVLLTTTDEIEKQLASGRVDARKFTQFLKLQNQRLPDLFNLRVTNEKGDLRYGSDFSELPVVNYADRNYFFQQRDNPETGLFVAKPVLGKTTKKWLLKFSRRINKPDGSFGGVVYGTISLAHFSDLFAVVEVGSKGAVTLRDADLGIIVSSGGIQLAGDLVGNNKLSEPFAAALKRNPNKGTYISGTSSIDHISRIHSYRKFEKYPFYINSGIADDVYLAAWYKKLWEVAALLLVFMLSSAAFSFLLIRLLHRQRSYEDELYQQKEYLQAIFEAEPECVKIIAPDGSLVDMNPAGLKMLEVDDLNEAKKIGLIGFVDADYRQAFIDLHARVCAGNSGMLEFPITGKKGTVRWLETHATPLRDNKNNGISLLGVTRDITERKSFQQELERQAHIDFLTGVNNRGYFMQLAESELARAKRYGSDLSMLMMDIDLFKQINDRHGHKVGDHVLKKLAEVCREVLRDVDIIGRVGGEEFAILLPETDRAEGANVAERLRVAIANARIPMESGLPIQLTVSIGVSSLLGKDDNLDVLSSQADKALYEAKKTGRNKVCVALS
jgi:diguanylate cyclase (GGDEF)-like protein/PAS domain S-box-containing protein